VPPPEVICGLEGNEDAGVYKIKDDLALVFTADFFPPIVDTPEHYGRIAAANSLSDIYAMGGKPLMALNLLAMPADMPQGMAAAILKGGLEKAREAGAVIIGGHSVNDKEPKYGLAVVGTVHPEEVLRNRGARPGDHLYLSKPLGIGILTTALKRELVTEPALSLPIQAMETLNDKACALALKHGARAATDVTGFGLLGHLSEMLSDGLGAALDFASLPFHERALAFASESVFPGGAFANREFYAPKVSIRIPLTEEYALALFSPETSGGLLLAVPPEHAPILEKDARTSGLPVWLIGEFIEGQGITVG
jgi:selenide,water dikinase